MTDIYGKSNLAIGYSGKATLKIKAGDKVISESLLHNNGGPELYYYLSLCLAGEYTAAQSRRPLKIRLFNTGNSTTDLPSAPVTSLQNAASTFISMVSAPTVKDASVVFHYVIPFSYITSSDVDQICLYGVGENDLKNYSAYFFIVDSENKLAPIKVDKAMSNLSLILDWELSFKSVKEFK